MLRRRLVFGALVAVGLAGACRGQEGPTASIAILCSRFVEDTVLIVRDTLPGYEVVRRCTPPQGGR